MLKSPKGIILPWLTLTAVLVMNMGAVGVESPAAPLPRPTGRTWLFLEPEQFSPGELAARLEEASAQLTPRARARRIKNLGWPPVRQCDLPPSRERIEAIEATGCRVVRALRYLNAIVVTGSNNEIETAGNLSFVAGSRPVMAFATEIATNEPGLPTQSHIADLADYGESLTQNLVVNIPAVHEEGYHGEAMLIGVQDTGFETRLHRAFRAIDLIATYDFVNGNTNVYDEEDVGSGLHGTRVLSVIAGLDSGNFIGVAPFAQFVLTKTENTASETPVEEDLWVAGLWFHDSLGVDVLSSSLSYRDWHEYEDYDGMTAVTSRAADSAFAAGIVLVNSMGNTGLAGYPESKLGAPADARGVISVGGVAADSTRWRSASQGPTYDGRIKPDVVAQSSMVYTVSTADNSTYSARSGTSFSTPIIAGVAALVVQANSGLTSAQVQDVLRSTSSNADSPDTLIGYGIVNALAAVILAREMSVVESQPPDEHRLFLLYPNPTNGRVLVVRFGYDDKPLTLRGIDGRVLQDGIEAGVLDLSDYPAGSYWVGSTTAGWRRLALLQ